MTAPVEGFFVVTTTTTTDDRREGEDRKGEVTKKKNYPFRGV